MKTRNTFCFARNTLLTIFFMAALLGTIRMNAQAPGCPNVNAGPDVELDCEEDCVDLTATFLETGATTSYQVNAIPYAPPFPVTGGNAVSVNMDDVWSPAINLPFDFCFFGNTYSQMLIGSNGVVTFDLTSNTPGGSCAWSFSESIPDSGLFSATIFGPYMDIDPSVSGSGQINFDVFGQAPCRTMVVNYPEVPYYSPQCNDLTMTTQIVIYETTNVVEVYLERRSDQCPTWNNGNAVLGIQNEGGTQGFFAPGRNTGNWAASNEAWRFTPNGASNINFAWLDDDNNVIGTTPTIEVCPPVGETTYTARAVYTNCNGDVIVETDTVTVTNVDDSDAVAYHYEDEEGNIRDEFCIGEDVYVNGSATLNTGSYYMDLWIVEPNGDYDWISGAGWITGSPDLVNITELFENDPQHPVTFQVGVTYAVKLAISHPDCGWVELLHHFTIIDCCDEFTDASFLLDVDASSNGYSLIAKDFETYDFINGVHEWYILSSPNQTGGPYTPVHSLITTGPGPVLLYNDAQYGLFYTVIHKVITECGELCYAKIQYQTGFREESIEIPPGEVDCCIIEEFWPNGVGEPIPFTAEFQIGLDLDGFILTQVAYEYENNPSAVHEWFLLTSPNPIGGPYTLVDTHTGVDYTFGPIQDGLYYFLIHKVRTDCQEACYGQSMCRNCDKAECESCGEIDCSILDEIIPDCETIAAPTNLQIVDGMFTWDPVPGAVEYIIESPGAGEPVIVCPCAEPVSIAPIHTNTTSVEIPEGLLDKCFIWRVRAICHDDTSSIPSDQQCYGGHHGDRPDRAKVGISPNPGDGNVTFTIETDYATPIVIEVYDFYGKTIQMLETDVLANQRGTVQWNGSRMLGRGMYVVRIQTNKETILKKLLIE